MLFRYDFRTINMYTTTNNNPTKKPKSSYLVRPRLGTSSKNAYSKTLTSPTEKKKRTKKFSSLKMDYHQKPDYADTAYREAVSRLRILLAESYIPIKRTQISRDIDSGGEIDSQSLISAHSRSSRLDQRRPYYEYFPILPRRYNYYAPITTSTEFFAKEHPKAAMDTTKFENNVAPPTELMSFVEKQETYIEQLEKESRFCREQLSSLLSKVKDVISENKNLHDKQKTYLLKSVSHHLETETDTETDFDIIEKTPSPPIKPKKSQILEGPAIVYESRISELEAQLTQAKIDLKEALEKGESYRKKLNDENQFSESHLENYKNKIDNLQREKEMLQETVKKLQDTVAKIRYKENDTSDQVQRTLNVAEQAQFEKNAAELEVRRLKDELDRQHNKLRETISEQTRRIAEERNAVERRYNQHVEQLTAELGVQWETINKLQFELDKQRRENADLNRELAQKQALIDEIKKDTQNKMMSLRSELGVNNAEKSALEQQIANLQLAKEKHERQSKQEQTRLQDEIQSLRQRLDRADADLIHSKRENLRLTEQIASLEKELKLNSVLNEEKRKEIGKSGEILSLPAPKDDNLASIIQDMDTKHAAAVAEFEDMIQSQNQLMDKLSNECHTLTQKLEASNLKHKEEIRELQTSLDRLNNRLNQSQTTSSSVKDEVYTDSNDKPAPTQLTSNQSRDLSRNNSLGKETTNNSNQPPQAPNQQYEQYPDENQMDYLTQEQYDQQYGNNQSYQQYPYDPNQQQYDVENNEQYLNDSNQQYAIDPNQPYTVDNDQQEYIADPNQQYNPETNQESTDR